MYHRFHDRFGTAGVVIAVIALIAALGGTAIAASGGLTPKQKKQVIKIAKKYAGKQGSEGPQGKEGPAGKEGPQGKEGPEGKQGLKGDQGEPGPFMETLKSGLTETGAWGYASLSAEEDLLIISYPFKLAAPIPTANFILLKPEEGETTECPGTAAEPKAASGNLCVYQKELFPGVEAKTEPALGQWPMSLTTGAELYLRGPFGAGSWAVKAP